MANSRIFIRAMEADGEKAVFFPLHGQGLNTKKQVVSSIFLEDVKDGVTYATDKVTETKSGLLLCSSLVQVTDDTGLILDTYPNEETKEACIAYKFFLNNRKSSDGNSGYVHTATDKPKAKKITLLAQLKGDKTLAPPTIADDGWYVDTDLWYYLLRTMHHRKNVLLVGNSGAGKTELAMFLTNRVKKHLEIFDMAVANPYKTFCGMIQAEEGSTYFKRARFSEAIEKKGVILLDELSRAAPSANNIFLPLLDNRRVLYVEEAIEDSQRQIKVHDDCMFWATANIGAEFIGTSMLDHALMNRFQMIEVQYPPKQKEAELLVKVCGLEKYEAELLAEIADQIRNDSSLSKDISTRQLIEVGHAMADGYSLTQAFEYTVLVQFEGGQGDHGERSRVKSILQAK